MYINRAVPACPANDNLLPVGVPLQDRARAYTELAPNAGRHGDLPLRRELRVCVRHPIYYHGNLASLLRFRGRICVVPTRFLWRSNLVLASVSMKSNRLSVPGAPPPLAVLLGASYGEVAP